MKVSGPLLRELINNIIDEEIRKVKGGYKVYPKKPQKGRKTRKALSKKPMSYKKALRQLRAVERSKTLSEGEGSTAGYDIPHEEVVSAIDRAMRMFRIQNNTLRNYLIEIAKTESGGNPKGLEVITHHKKNPFQLDPPSIKNSRENINLRHWRKFFSDRRKETTSSESVLGIKDYTDEKVRSNIKSGAIFALMHVLWMLKAYKPEGEVQVPQDINTRSSLWKKKYNTLAGKGSVKDYKFKNTKPT